MARSRFTDPVARTAFHDAITAIEAGSAVEVVVAVRPHARRSLVPHAIVAFVAATAMLGDTLYADTEFELWSIWLLPLLAALIGALIVEVAPPLYRVLLPARQRASHVAEAARVAFYDLRIAATTRRTGVLALFALRERTALLLPDVGAARAIDRKTLARWSAELTARIPAGGTATAQALAGLAAQFAAALPHVADQVDELPDDMIMVHPRGARTGEVAP